MINYIIATYAGISKKRELYDKETEFILQKHLYILSKCLKNTTKISQVTIVKPYNNGLSYKNYYCINKYIKDIEKLNIPVVIYDTGISFGSSYSQYIYAFRQNPKFEYYIVMEDDYSPYPLTLNFDDKLLEEYKKVNYEGFLSAYCNSWKIGPMYHSMISVGIISKKSFNKALNKDNKCIHCGFNQTGIVAGYCCHLCKTNLNSTIFSKHGCFCEKKFHVTVDPNIGQYEFSLLFKNYDWANSYMAPFWDAEIGVLLEFSHKLNDYLLVPIQLIEKIMYNKFIYVIENNTDKIKKTHNSETINYINNKLYLNYAQNLKLQLGTYYKNIFAGDYDCCLIVTFYAGLRSHNQQTKYKDYLNLQTKYLKEKKHNLSRIVFVISEDNRTTDLTEVKDGITYYYRKNKNLSFGGWVDSMFKFNHDYYILCEDDYYFTKNNFDKILINDLILKNVDYLVTWKQYHLLYEFNGLISTCGILSQNSKKYLVNYNNINNDKCMAMNKFLRLFKTIGSLSNYDLFIYDNDKHLTLYSNKGEGIINNETNKIKCKNCNFNQTGLVPGYCCNLCKQNKAGYHHGCFCRHNISENNIDYNRVFLCHYNFFSKNKEKFIY